MTRVSLIQCTRTKRDERAQARALYDESAYFRKMKQWAMSRGNRWFILSAKHGLLHPDKPVDPYDAVGLSAKQADSIAEMLSDMDVDTVDVTAGRKYTDELVPALELQGIDVINHFAGMQIGKRMAALDEATDDT